MKKVLIISSSPNDDGLTAACVHHAEKGISRAGGEYKAVSLNKINIKKCNACNNGWGICRTKHICCIDDDFGKIQQIISEVDAIFIITPVYWGEMSEVCKCFFDRLRRCEASKSFLKSPNDIISKDNSILSGKDVILVAAAGGSGNGTITCLLQMENLSKHVRANILDRITITRFNRRYKLKAIEEAGYELGCQTSRKT